MTMTGTQARRLTDREEDRQTGRKTDAQVSSDCPKLPALVMFIQSNKFDTNKDASNKFEKERISLNLLEFT